MAELTGKEQQGQQASDCLYNNQEDNVLLAGQGRNAIMPAENQKIKRLKIVSP